MNIGILLIFIIIRSVPPSVFWSFCPYFCLFVRVRPSLRTVDSIVLLSLLYYHKKLSFLVKTYQVVLSHLHMNYLIYNTSVRLLPEAPFSRVTMKLSLYNGKFFNILAPSVADPLHLDVDPDPT